MNKMLFSRGKQRTQADHSIKNYLEQQPSGAHVLEVLGLTLNIAFISKQIENLLLNTKI